MFLKSDTETPPSGFRFYEIRSDKWWSNLTKNGLMISVATHRHNQKYAPVSEGFPSLIAEIEDQICQRLSPANQLAHCKTGIKYGRSVGWRELLAFTKTVGGWLAGGAKLVDQAEAERRAKICSDCPLQVPGSGCSSCVGEIADFVTGTLKRSTSLDSKLENCGWCKCVNKVQVHLPLDVLKRGKAGLSEPPKWCWQHDDFI